MLKYDTIEKDMRDAILSGKYRKGDVLPTESELCKKYKVSHPTVRSAYQILEENGLIYREKGRGTFVKFEKKRRSTYTVGLIFDRPNDAPFIGTNVYINARIEGMKKVLADSGHSASLLVVDSEKGDYRDIERMPPDGVLDIGNTISPALKRMLQEQNIPLIGMSGGDTSRYDDIPYVLTDESPGMKEAVDHAVAAGYDTFGFIGNYPERYTRINGFLAPHGRSLLTEHTFMLPPVPWYNASHIKPAMLALEYIRAQKTLPSLFFFSSDEVAYHFAVLLEASGKIAGAEYGIIGFGDYETKTGVPEHERIMSTINSPAFESGTAAAEMLLAVLGGKTDVKKRTVHSTYIQRKTTR